MRMRKRHNLEPRMEKCINLLEEAPEGLKGIWAETYYGFDKTELELGCGKGKFTAELAASQPSTLLIALEKIPDAMIIAMERVQRAGLANVRFIDGDASKINEMFLPGEVSAIYINFCDPWPKSRDAKFRLTAPSFLRSYADILPVGGEIRFKTDNKPLFDWSLEQLSSENWELREVTNDLHASGPCGIMTDYEAKFYAEGIKINRLVAVKRSDTKTSADGEVPRLRNASLSDARGAVAEPEKETGEN